MYVLKSWPAQLKRRGRLVKILDLLTLIFCVGVIAAVSCFELCSPDMFWHLKMGLDLIHSGLSPFMDHYSFTYSGHPIRLVAWPFQVGLATFYTMFGGVVGICVFRFVIWITEFWFVSKLLGSTIRSQTLRILGLLFFLFTLVYHTWPRPEQVSLMLEPLLILLLMRWRNQPSIARTLGIAMLLWLWSNIHSSSIIAYVVAGSFLIERAMIVVRARGRDWKPFVWISLLWIVVGFANLDLLHPLLLQFQFDPSWKKMITEYAVIPFTQQYPVLILYWLMLALSLPGLWLRREYAGLVIVAVMGVSTLGMTKLFTHMIMTTLPFVLGSFEFYVENFAKENSPSRIQKPLAIAVSLAVLFVAYDTVTKSLVRPLHPLTLRASEDFFPVDVVRFMKEHQIKGRVLNEYAYGGYLIHKLSPDVQVFIDGRTNILYPLALMKDYLQLSQDTVLFRREVEKYSIDYVIGSLYGQATLAQTALSSGLFSVAYVGKHAILLQRGPTDRFPLAAQLLQHPECLKLSDLEEMKIEQSRLPPHSSLYRFYEIAIQSFENQAKPVRLNAARSRIPYMLRLAAEIKWRRGKVDEARDYILRIPRKDATDIANLAEIDCIVNDCKDAESLLNHVPTIGISQSVLERSYVLLRRIEETQQGLHLFSEERISKLRHRIRSSELPTQYESRRQFCKSQEGLSRTQN